MKKIKCLILYTLLLLLIGAAIYICNFETTFDFELPCGAIYTITLLYDVQ